MKPIKLEYVWLDGYTPEPNLRRKVKIINEAPEDFNPLYDNRPEW